jgi:hypothetical protein
MGFGLVALIVLYLWFSSPKLDISSKVLIFLTMLWTVCQGLIYGHPVM